MDGKVTDAEFDSMKKAKLMKMYPIPEVLKTKKLNLHGSQFFEALIKTRVIWGNSLEIGGRKVYTARSIELHSTVVYEKEPTELRAGAEVWCKRIRDEETRGKYGGCKWLIIEECTKPTHSLPAAHLNDHRDPTSWRNFSQRQEPQSGAEEKASLLRERAQDKAEIARLMAQNDWLASENIRKDVEINRLTGEIGHLNAENNHRYVWIGNLTTANIRKDTEIDRLTGEIGLLKIENEQLKQEKVSLGFRNR